MLYGLRALAVACFAAGIGLMAALASVADAILFRPLPVPKPAEIVRIYTSSPGQSMGFVSYPDFDDFRGPLPYGRGSVSSRERQGAVPALAAVTAQTQVLLAIGDTPAQVRTGLAVTP